MREVRKAGKELGKGEGSRKGVGRGARDNQNTKRSQVDIFNNQLSSLLSFGEVKETLGSHSLAKRPPGFEAPSELPNPYYVCMKQAASPLT